jgi:hypothetical protein
MKEVIVMKEFFNVLKSVIVVILQIAIGLFGLFLAYSDGNPGSPSKYHKRHGGVNSNSMRRRRGL